MMKNMSSGNAGPNLAAILALSKKFIFLNHYVSKVAFLLFEINYIKIETKWLISFVSMMPMPDSAVGSKFARALSEKDVKETALYHVWIVFSECRIWFSVAIMSQYLFLSLHWTLSSGNYYLSFGSKFNHFNLGTMYIPMVQMSSLQESLLD